MAIGYNPYNNYYMQDLQNMRDRIDRQMQQYQQNQNQMQQPMQPITQNFQLAPTQPTTELEGKYANNIDEVRNTFVIKTGIFTTKDFSTIWVKDVAGNIKTYRTEEVIELDEKDKKIKEQDTTILLLQKQINELKGAIMNANASDNTNISKTIGNKKSDGISNDK
jgi:FtsZ-binding cell division protein ZapB